MLRTNGNSKRNDTYTIGESMKRVILVLMMLAWAGMAQADVTYRVLAKNFDDGKNILTLTQYKIDGVEVISRYPKLDGKYYWVVRYTASRMVGMSDVEIDDLIIKDIKGFCRDLTISAFSKIKNQDIFDNHMESIVGKTGVLKSTKLQIDTDGDGIDDTEATIKTDGTHIESPIIISP